MALHRAVARSSRAGRGSRGGSGSGSGSDRWLLALAAVLAVFTAIEIVPYIVTMAFPDLSYGSTAVGELQQRLNKYGLSYFDWACATALLAVLVALVFRRTRNPWARLAAAAAAAAVLYVLVFPILNLCNLLLCFGVHNPPFIPAAEVPHEFPVAPQLEADWTVVRAELDAFELDASKRGGQAADCLRNSNPGFTIEQTPSPDRCWRMILLKKAGRLQADMLPWFPRTLDLLRSPLVHNAFFSILDPGVQIPGHVGYYKGYLRYHLGIRVPQHGPRPYIVCGGQKYTWREGEGVLFDDMYYHRVVNPSDQPRVVLYLDVRRAHLNSFLQHVNAFGAWYIASSPMLQRYLRNQHAGTKTPPQQQ